MEYQLPSHSPAARRESGQNLIEFALVLGLIVTFFLGMVDLTNVLQQRADMDKIVRQAARQAGEFGGGKEQVRAYVDTQLALLGYDPLLVNAFEVEAQALQVKAGSMPEEYELVYMAGQETCTYGEYITVRFSMDWNVSIPAQLFFSGFDQGDVLTMEHTSKCWRAE